MPIVEHIFADQYGLFIGKFQERIKLMKGNQIIQQAPLLHLQSVTIAQMGVTISADAIAACTERGIPIVMLDGYGDVFATLYASGLVGTVLTRREQLRAYDDERAFVLARAFGMGKLYNQMATLRYWAKNRHEAHPDDARLLRDTAQQLHTFYAQIETYTPIHVDACRADLLGLEGIATHHYWQAARCLVPPHYQWTHRHTRGANDPVNSLLNYGYGILYGEIEKACVMAGLDPYAGFLHADRPGKPSLVLDVIEEFRQLVVDRVVFGLVARQYTIAQDELGMLETDTKRDFASKIIQQLDAQTRYHGKRTLVRHIIQTQTRQLVTFLRGERDTYSPFMWEE
jgi:CRISP-associated protein Cas1